MATLRRRPRRRNGSLLGAGSGTVFSYHCKVRILCEIVGATNLSPALDAAGSDGSPSGGIALSQSMCVSSRIILDQTGKASPYCKVRFGGRQIHRTKTLSSCNDPIWAADTGSLFCLEASYEEFFIQSNPLLLELRDKDTILGTSARIGSVQIDAETILEHCNEERVEFEITDGAGLDCLSMLSEDGDDGAVAVGNTKLKSSQNVTAESSSTSSSDTPKGKKRLLALRFRVATEGDLSFLQKLENGVFPEPCSAFEDTVSTKNTKQDPLYKQYRHPFGLITESVESEVGYQGILDNLARTFFGTTTDKNGVVKIRTKPGPDPQRPESETTYLSEKELLAESYAPSRNWIEAGSGSLGKVFVEVLRCEGLPNLDAGGAVGNKTDSFVCLVHEDAVVQTTVIDDSLSPLWMPWTQRAFAFNRAHPLSALYLAVFDYDIGPMNEHDGIGRVAVNLCNFAPDTVYTLKYNLYPSSVTTEREAVGTVTIRLRLETPNEKALLMAGKQHAPRVHINVRKSKSLAVAKYTCLGKFDEDKYDMKLLRSYLNEVMEYKRAASYNIGDAARSLILWRGQVKVGHLDLPIHSAMAFFAGIYVVDRPHALPSFLFFGIAWLMLACMGQRVRHPSPWKRCRPFSHYMGIMRMGPATQKSAHIKAYEGAEASAAFEDAWMTRIKQDMDAAEKRWELQQELTEIGDDAIHTKDNGIQIDPLARLFPVQRRLGGICHVFRIIKTVLTWEESTISFLITAFCLAMGMILFVLPTTFLLYWALKISIWVFLGPWMCLVDVFLVSKVDLQDAKGRKMRKEKTMHAIAEQFKKMSSSARRKGEEATKLRAIRILRFGKYIVRVPAWNVSRHYDYPLPESTALPVEEFSARSPLVDGWEDRMIITGQKLCGAMIPELTPRSTEGEDLLRNGKEVLLRQKAVLEEGDQKPPGQCDTSADPDTSSDEGDINQEEGVEVDVSEIALLLDQQTNILSENALSEKKYIRHDNESDAKTEDDKEVWQNNAAAKRDYDENIRPEKKKPELRRDSRPMPGSYIMIPSDCCVDGNSDEASALSASVVEKPMRNLNPRPVHLSDRQSSSGHDKEEKECAEEEEGVEIVAGTCSTAGHSADLKPELSVIYSQVSIS